MNKSDVFWFEFFSKRSGPSSVELETLQYAIKEKNKTL